MLNFDPQNFIFPRNLMILYGFRGFLLTKNAKTLYSQRFSIFMVNPIHFYVLKRGFSIKKSRFLYYSLVIFYNTHTSQIIHKFNQTTIDYI